MSAKLYEPCTICKGEGKLPREGELTIYGTPSLCRKTCPACQGAKFVEIGITSGQLKRLVMKAEGLDRIERHIKTLDLVELGIIADYLAMRGRFEDRWRVVEVQEALAAMTVILKDTKRKLSRTPETGRDGEAGSLSPDGAGPAPAPAEEGGGL